MKLRIFATGLLLTGAGTLYATEPVRFGRDILPILSDNCLSCHGPDESTRKAGLRLDLREEAIRANKDGISAVVPLHPENSELLKRIVSADPEEVMPTPKSHKPPLKSAQVELLRRWISEGAPWGRHWAFERPQKSLPPSESINPVDAYVRAGLEKEGLTPASRAETHTLLRRISFDLTGLPPTASELHAFLSDSAPDAWRRAVQRLLTSAHFGERMAMWWLDVARYADTDGFQSDSTRANWPWRDWVTNSFNANKPFDAFITEQFAGDLLPNPTPDQRIATCFHRNHMANGEGGRDPEESRVDYVIDRVNTTGTALLGLTLGCTQCHNHKFDPVTQADYYSLTAFFNSIDETGAAGSEAKPFYQTHSAHAAHTLLAAHNTVSEWKRAEAEARLAAADSFEKNLPTELANLGENFQEWRPLRANFVASAEGTALHQDSDQFIHATGPNPKQDEYRIFSNLALKRATGLKLEIFPNAQNPTGGLSRGASGEFVLTDLKVQVRQSGKSEVRDIAVKSAVADFSADKKTNGGYGDVKDTLDDDPRNGWSTKGAPQNVSHTAVFEFFEPLVLEADEEIVIELRQRSTLGDANIGCFKLFVTDQAGETVRSITPGILQTLADMGIRSAGDLSEPLRKRLFENYLEDYAPYLKVRTTLARANGQAAEAKAANGPLKVMVLEERTEPRDTFVLVRGVWDKHGEKVEPGVPVSIAPWPLEQPRNRLGLARWIVSRENPLTARVVVNQLWQMMFGNGLVRTPEDFGLQGERPTHPELLDWLAVELIESGWNTKHILELIATSDTYQQSSNVSVDLLNRDPANRLLARSSRFRLPSWMLRDSVLHTAGLLTTSTGGPPMKPYQPAGVWEELFMGRFKYEPSLGATQYRRTLYAFWRRAIAPTFLFDAAQRRVCEVRSNRTNTPLQALTLLNDETSREAARVLAARAIMACADPEARLFWLSEAILSRAPKAAEVKLLQGSLSSGLTHYRAHPEDALKVLQAGQFPAPVLQQQPDVAAYALVASLLLNLDEAITHE